MSMVTQSWKSVNVYPLSVTVLCFQAYTNARKDVQHRMLCPFYIGWGKKLSNSWMKFWFS